jgi:hypothetical protein
MNAATLDQSSTVAAIPAEPKDLYRILLFQKRGSELLVAGEGPPFTLPCVEIPRWERVEENVVASVRKYYGMSAICLFTPELPDATTGPLYEVIESTEANCAAPVNMSWIWADSCSEHSFADAQDFAATTSARSQIRKFQLDGASGPFGKPGWWEELFSWVQHEIGPHGLRLTGGFRQLNASPTFALLRLETNRQALWFKAVGEPNLREFPISVTLSRLFPTFVPTVIATRPECHGWLTTEFPGGTLDESPTESAYEQASKTLAELQAASLGKIDLLLEAGGRDLRVHSLLTLVDPFIEVMWEQMKRQEKTPPPALNREQLLTLGASVKEALSCWGDLNIPDTLGHLDFNLGNILCSKERCIFVDWAEAYIGPPFMTLEYFREHVRRLQTEQSRIDALICESYWKRWSSLLSPEVIAKGKTLAPLLAVFAYATGIEDGHDSASLCRPGRAPYLRSLTRRMLREAQALRVVGKQQSANLRG